MRKLFSWLDNNLLSVISGFLLVFIPLYPKRPLADILPGYIVRMRLEDVVVSISILVWCLYFVRGKIKIKENPLFKPILIYLAIGLLSVFSAVFLIHTVPMEKIHVEKIALHYLRRIEYFSLFFIFFSSLKSLKSIRNYLILLVLTILAVSIYGFGQKYLYWPAFSTMNREFSKGWMLYLTEHARVLSTFGGHYDLAAFTMMALIILWSLFFTIRNILLKSGLFLVLACAFWLLILTASRTSFLAYLAGVSFMIFFWSYRKGLKWALSRWIMVIFLSVTVMLSFGDLSERFTKLLRIDERLGRIKSLVMMPIGKPPKDKAYFLVNNPDSALADITSKSDQPPTPKRPSDVFQDIPLNVDATGSATVSSQQRTYSKTAFMYDLSTAIRLDALWPMAIKGFKRNIFLGSGYSTLNKTQFTQFTEAESTDNDFLRALGETGLLGFISFYGIMIFIIFSVWKNISVLKDPLLFGFSVALAGLVTGMLVNAVYIDVFESSKVAFTFWGLSGLVLSGIYISRKNAKNILPPKIPDWNSFKRWFINKSRFIIRNDYFWLIPVLVLALALRLYKINTPLADWHSWRQADTSSVTANYVKSGINILYPTYHDLSNIASGKDNPKGLRMVEFPLYNVMSVITDKIIIGYNLEVSGRLTSVFSSLGTLIFIFLLVRKYFGRRVAFTAAVIFSILPYNIFYSRVILPEPLLVFLTTGMIYFADRFSNRNLQNSHAVKILNFKSTILLILLCIFSSAALLVKPYAAFLFLPVTYSWFRGFRLSVKSLTFYILFLLVIFTPLALWRMWISHFPEGVPAYQWLLNGDGIRFKGAFFQWIFADRLGRMILGYFGLPLFFSGIIFSRWRKAGIFYMWGIGILLYVFVIATGNVRHDYYQILTIPIIAVFVAIGIWEIYEISAKMKLGVKSSAFILIMLVFMEMFGWYHIRDLYNINHPEIVEAGSRVERLTKDKSLVIAPYNGDTAFLYQTKRTGWPVIEDTIDKMIKRGAQYYVSVNQDDLTKQLLLNATNPDPYLRSYKLIERTDKYTIIQLVPDNKLPK